jgi:two-component system, OmpR family, phosphate regulon sensor histidine kinase PhoR
MPILSDKELLEELQLRFEKNKHDLEAKNKLLDTLKSVNTKLLDAEKVKSEFLSNIRNEINNPLTSIIGLSSLLQNSELNKADILKKAELIYEDAQKLSFQLRNIFVAAEIEAGKAQLEITKINLIDLINTILQDFKWFSNKKNIDVQLITKTVTNDPVYNDSEKLAIIFSNFLANAIEFSPSNSKIQIILDNTTVEIKDSGVGIASEHHKLIFDRFKQLNSGSTKLHAGHGLGLSIVKELSALINLQINMQSELGEGTSFKLDLFPFDAALVSGSSTSGDAFLFNDDALSTF